MSIFLKFTAGYKLFGYERHFNLHLFTILFIDILIAFNIEEFDDVINSLICEDQIQKKFTKND